MNIDLEISKAHLEAAGWSLDNYNTSNPFDCHCLYVRDFRNGQVQVFTVPQSGFDSAAVPFSAEELAQAIAFHFKRLGKGKALPKADAKALPSIVGAYFQLTQTYRLWKAKASQGERLHGAICIYPVGHVRPFAANCRNTLLAAEEFVRLTDEVRAIDLPRHPEWFANK